MAMRSERGTALKAGKVPPEVLSRVLAIPRGDCRELIVPPAPGEDAAVLRLPGGLVTVTSDPITFPTPRPGHFAVCVNANDIAAMGARPRYFTLTLLMPPGSAEGDVLAIVRDAVETARAAGITLIGGHTEVTDAVRWPVVTVTMLGEAVSAEPLRTGGAQPGDAILQVGFMALEGTAILADTHREPLSRAVGLQVVETARHRLNDPGISVVGPALQLASCDEVHALHDPTEGGLATGLREMALASGVGVRVEEAELLRLPETDAICQHLGVDPLGLIASGCLLAAVAPQAATRLAGALRAAGYMAAVIGLFTVGPDLRFVERDGTVRELPEFDVDELARMT